MDFSLNKILVVEDNEELLAIHKKRLSNFFQVYTALNGNEGLEVIKNHGQFKVVISDMKMPGMDGINFLSKVRDISHDTTRILITGFAELDSVIDAVNAGYIFRFLKKPCPSEKLVKAINDGIKQYNLITYEKILNKKLVKEIRRRKKAEYKLKKINLKLKKLSNIDTLTRTYNRRYFFKQLEKEFNRAKRYSNDLTLLMIDLDYFKDVNDKYGHLIGDQVLKRTANAIKNNLRTIDIVGRYGGEEFCIILPETKLDDAVRVAERLRGLINDIEYVYNDSKFNVSSSIGIALLDKKIMNVNDFIDIADKAMYMAKESGRNCVKYNVNIK